MTTTHLKSKNINISNCVFIMAIRKLQKQPKTTDKYSGNQATGAGNLMTHRAVRQRFITPSSGTCKTRLNPHWLVAVEP